jgi:DNA-binding MarR family transcriptional regulator
MFRELESGYNQRSEQIYSRLAPAEREVLYSGFDQIGDFRGVPPSPLRSDEHPSRPPIRRYTVAIGFLGRGLLDTSLSSTLWMILESIKRLPAGQCTPAHLSELLGITRSTMTYSLKTLAGLDAIEKTVDESDSRSYWLSLNSKGEQLRDQVKEAAVGFLDGAFGERNTDEQDFFLATYLKVIGGAAEAQLKVLIDLNLNKKAAASQASGDTLSIEFSQATTSEELQAARAFALRTLVNSNLAHKAPAGIADDKSMSFTARLSNQILGFIQVSSKPTQQVELLLCEPLVAEVLGASLIQRARAVLKVPDGQEMRVPLVTNC